MCGIFGFNWADKKLLNEGLEKIRHRGPDGSGTFIARGVSLGHNRLSIIDLSKAGKQPMSNEDGSIWITFCGEIFNYQEIRASLKNKHRFVSNTDTEVLIHLYEEKGMDMVHDLQGMFAFCILDSKKDILFLARDRLGVKPLYYTHQKGKFLFASEVKAILAVPEIKPLLNLSALPSYLAFRANTNEETFFKGVYKLPPGHILTYALKSKRLNIQKYWDITFNPIHDSFETYALRVRTLLEDAVRCRLMSDVPFGAYLSGGVDSGAIVALMNRHCSQPIKTFSVGFAEEKYSELKEARVMSRALKTDHHELTITASSIKALPEIIYHADEPMADPTAIPTYFLSQYAKKYCTVILTGEGADEIFGGYPQYRFMKLHDSFLRHVPQKARDIIGRSIALAPQAALDAYFPFASALGAKGRERFKHYLHAERPVEQYLHQITIFDQSEQTSLLGSPSQLYEKYSSYFENASQKNILGKCAYFDLKGPLVDDLLMKVDKNTMAFGVEARTPFLDYRVVELAAQIPEEYKVDMFSKNKAILRGAVADLLPAETAQRKKRHFFVPIEKWIERDLQGVRATLLSEKYVRSQGIFNWEYIDTINKQFESSPLFYARQLWSLLVFQLWYRQHIEKKGVLL